MTHPLTDEICEDLVLQFYRADPDTYPDLQYLTKWDEVNQVDMRKAADWQLEQDQKELEDFLEQFLCRGHGWEANSDLRAFVHNFKSDMRPND